MYNIFVTVDERNHGRENYMTKAFRNCLISIVLFSCFTFLFLCSIKVKAADPYTLYVGSTKVTDANASNITASDITGKVSYDAEKRILTLDHATISGVSEQKVPGGDVYKSYYAKAGIYFDEGDLTIDLIGNNVISSGVANWGVASNGKITFTGSGSLTLPSHRVTDDDAARNINDYGICCISMVVSKGTTVTSYAAESSRTYSHGLCITDRLEVYGNLKAVGTSFKSGYSAGFASYGVYMASSDTKIIVDGTLYAEGASDNSSTYGIYFAHGGNMTVGENADVTAIGKTKGISVGTLSLASSALKILAGTAKSTANIVSATSALTCKYISINKTNKAPVRITSPATSISSLKAAKKAFTVKWKKKSVTGYQIRYSLKSSMAGAKTITIGKQATISKKVTKLKAKKKYYVQVRTFKKVSGKAYYSGWCAKKTVKTK